MARERKRMIELPWEGKRARFFSLSRDGVLRIFGAIAALLLVVFVLAREEREAGIRATRGRIGTAYASMANFRADHPGMCPPNWATLVSTGYMKAVPVDAWGHGLRLRCPGRRDPSGVDIVSDGPDGEYGGLDRVE